MAESGGEKMEKKERRRVLIHRQKSYLTAGVVTLVAVVAMMGAYQYEKACRKTGTAGAGDSGGADGYR